MVKKGIPKSILRDLDIRSKEKKLPPPIVIISLEESQARLTIPSRIKLEMDLRKGQKFKVYYNKKEKELIYKF